jgi:hypothetical protein
MRLAPGWREVFSAKASMMAIRWGVSFNLCSLNFLIIDAFILFPNSEWFHIIIMHPPLYWLSSDILGYF